MRQRPMAGSEMVLADRGGRRSRRGAAADDMWGDGGRYIGRRIWKRSGHGNLLPCAARVTASTPDRTTRSRSVVFSLIARPAGRHPIARPFPDRSHSVFLATSNQT